jgi:hypothetical protein
MRHVFRLPAELPANWIFRLTETQGRKQWMQAVERFTLCYAVLPIYVFTIPLAVRTVGWSTALRISSVQVLISLTLFNCLFYGWQQLPFTCSYVPGKRPMESSPTTPYEAAIAADATRGQKVGCVVASIFLLRGGRRCRIISWSEDCR